MKKYMQKLHDHPLPISLHLFKAQPTAFKHFYILCMHIVAPFCSSSSQPFFFCCTECAPHCPPPTAPSSPRHLSVATVFEDGIELNWLPPMEPNGEVLHYVIHYTPEGGTEQSIDTGSNLTHYNLTGLERNRMYNNFRVQAFNLVGRSDRSAVIVQYNHKPPGELLKRKTTLCTRYNFMYVACTE